jgi:hypothetical protein
MGIEKRRTTKNAYYCRSERRDGKVVRTYVGLITDPVVATIHRLDRGRRALHRLNVAAERDEIAADYHDAMQAFDVRVQTILITNRANVVMMAQSPMFASPALASNNVSTTLPTKTEFLDIVDRAEDGCEEAQIELRRLLDESPELWQSLGDIGRHVEKPAGRPCGAELLFDARLD